MMVRNEKREKYYIFLISLIAHLILIFILLTTTYHQLPPFLHKEKEKSLDDPINQQQSIAALKPRISNFGAPVLFHDEVNIKQEHFEPDQREPEPEQKDNDGQQAESMQEIKKDEKPIENKNETLAEKIDNQTAKIANNKTNKKNENKQKKVEITPKAELIQQAQAKKKIITRKIINERESTGPIQRQLTFADLAQGFIQSVKNEGSDWLKRDGDPNKRPDLKEMKYLTYVQRIVWYMQNEWRINKSKLKANLMQNYALTIAILINRTGQLEGVRILKQSGSNEFDSFLIKGIEKAAPYPEVPSFLKHDPFELVLTIQHMQETSPWHVNLRSSPPFAIGR